MNNLFPNFQKYSAYKEAVLGFHRQFHDFYLENESLDDYTPKIKDFEDAFLIFLPHTISIYEDSDTLHPIIYVQKQPVSDVADHSRYRYFVFESTRDSLKDKLQKQTGTHVSLDYLFELGDTHAYLLEGEKFDAFNPRCVFQLQPEHYHYFAPYFSRFQPFMKKLSEQSGLQFIPTFRPNSSL